MADASDDSRVRVKRYRRESEEVSFQEIPTEREDGRDDSSPALTLSSGDGSFAVVEATSAFDLSVPSSWMSGTFASQLVPAVPKGKPRPRPCFAPIDRSVPSTTAPSHDDMPKARPLFSQRSAFTLRSSQDARSRPTFRPARDYAIYPSESRLSGAASGFAGTGNESGTSVQDDSFVDDLLQAADAFASTTEFSFPPEPPRVVPGKFALPARPMNSTSRVILQNDVHAKLRAKGLLLWRQLVLLLSPLSSALQEILESASSEALLSQLVSSVADTTLVRYVQSCLQYFALLQDLGFDASRISQVQAYDVMIQLYRSPEDEEEVPASCFPLNTLKALRWMVKVATISFPDLYTGLFHSVAHQRNEADRRESVPLPLDFVAYLEFCLLSNAFPELQLNIGALLLMIWGSLRFSDAMHVKWGSLLYEQEVGRGISFRTKTSVRGAPFGVIGVGLVGPWFSTWLALLKNEWVRIGAEAGQVEPDALLFHSSDDELFVPMTYGEGGSPVLEQNSQLCSTIDVDADLAGVTSPSASGSGDVVAPEKAATLPLHSSGELGSPEELLFIVTAKTIHKAVVCSELDRCTTFQGVPFASSHILCVMAQNDCFPENFSELSAWDLWDASERFAGRDGYSREQWFNFWREALQTGVDAPTQEPDPALPTTTTVETSTTLPTTTTVEPAPSDELDGATTEEASTLTSAIDPSSTFPAPEAPYHEWGDEWVPTPAPTWEEEAWAPATPWVPPEITEYLQRYDSRPEPTSLPPTTQGPSETLPCTVEADPPVTVPNGVLSTEEQPSSLPPPTTEEADDFNYVPWNFSQLSEADLWNATAFFEDWMGYDRQQWLEFWLTLRASRVTSSTLHPPPDDAAGSSTEPTQARVLAVLLCSTPTMLTFIVADSVMENTVDVRVMDSLSPRSRVQQLATALQLSIPASAASLGDLTLLSFGLGSVNLEGLDAFLTAKGWRDFEKAYPSEVLDEEDYNSARPKKMAKFESFTDVLYDDVPSRNIAENMGLYGISNLLSIHSNAIALADIAHLATLRAYERKFLKHVQARTDPTLRPPNAQECEAADRRCWEVVGQLRQEGWSVDDALHEFTDVRAELVALLAPRLAPFKGKKGDGKGGKDNWKGQPHKGGKTPGGRGGAGAGKGKSNFTKGTHAFEWASKAKINGEQKVLCMAYSTHKGCTSANCKFEHLCPVQALEGDRASKMQAVKAWFQLLCLQMIQEMLILNGFFLDINGGSRRPLSAAFLGAGCDTFSVAPEVFPERDLLQDDFFFTLLRVCHSGQVALLHILLLASDFTSILFERMIQIAHACFAAGSHVLLSQHSSSAVWSHSSVLFLLRQMSSDIIFWDPRQFGCNFSNFGILAASFSSLQHLATSSSATSDKQATAGSATFALSADFVLAVAKSSLHLFSSRSPEPLDLHLNQVPFLRQIKQTFEPPFANQDGAGIYSVPLGGKLLEARHTELKTKQDLCKVRTSNRIWMRVTNPKSDRRSLSPASRTFLAFWKEWCQRPQPYTSLSIPLRLQVEAFADARADGELIGIGGFLAFPSGKCIWFSQSWQLSDLSILKLDLRRPAHKDTACYETLAQIALVHLYRSVFPSGRVAVRLPSFSDNASTEALGAKLYTSKWPLGAFAQKLSLISAASGIELDISHIAGEKNEDADLLSRWNQTDALPEKWRKEDRVDCSLQFIWFFRKEVLVWPSHFSLPTGMQERHVSDDDL
ncbi:unnamed protein product [Symbiodinium sp. CCMP2592]|nr:unnamed protein product [Symbiodinium sp. CCMP2592]